MKIHKIHSWENLTIDDARNLQISLASRLVLDGESDNVDTIGAGDLAFTKDGYALGAIVLLSYPDFELLELHTGYEKVRFPYIPGYLSFREAPLLLELFEKLKQTPDLIMIDGQGIAHPRKLGLAAHIGLFLQKPTIGVAKSRFVGVYDEPDMKKGSWTWLTYKSEKIGMVVRTRTDIKPVFISPGNLINFDNALKWTLATSIRYRIPVPTALADREVGSFKKSREAD